MSTDLDILKVVSFKLSTDGSLPANRNDIRDVGKIRDKYRLARQRDDEHYTDYVNRLILALEEKANGSLS